MENYNRDTRGIVLNVPYAEKEEAKILGARWDPDLKKWFVPKGVEPKPFAKWFLDKSESSETSRR